LTGKNTAIALLNPNPHTTTKTKLVYASKVAPLELAMKSQSAKMNKDRLQHAAYWLMAMVVISIFALVFFRVVPELDIFVSRLAFTVKQCPTDEIGKICGDFPLVSNGFLNWVREISLQMPNVIGIGIFGYLLYQILLNPNTAAAEIRKINLVIWSVLLATVVLINLILKELWGRPRPFKVDEFGGEYPFVLPGSISQYCDSNCSFVSGEASSAAWLFTLLVFLPSRWRVAGGIFLAAYLIFFSGLRIAFGRHFLSDVVMSALFTFCVIAALNLLFSTRFFTRMFEKFAQWSNQVAFDLKVR